MSIDTPQGEQLHRSSTKALDSGHDSRVYAHSRDQPTCEGADSRLPNDAFQFSAAHGPGRKDRLSACSHCRRWVAPIEASAAQVMGPPARAPTCRSVRPMISGNPSSRCGARRNAFARSNDEIAAHCVVRRLTCRRAVTDRSSHQAQRQGGKHSNSCPVVVHGDRVEGAAPFDSAVGDPAERP